MIPAAFAWPTNGYLIADVARLGYLPGSVLDVTYGRGAFWSIFRPEKLTAHDLKTDGVDFRSLPHPDGSFATVVIDGPYKLNGTPSDPDERYGVDVVRSWQDRHALIRDGISECARVVEPEGFVLVKCQPQVCVDEATEILTQRGWLTFREVSAGDVAYTLNHETGFGEWQPVQEVIVLPAARRRMVSMERRGHSSLTTPDHRWPVITHRMSPRSWATSASFTVGDTVPCAAELATAPTAPTYKDAFVELVGWFWTEGCIHRQSGARGGEIRRTSGYGDITQSMKVNPDNCQRIERCLRSLYGEPVVTLPGRGRSDGWARWAIRDRPGPKQVRSFILSADLGRSLLAVVPDKMPTFAFLSSLTRNQLLLFIEVSLLADGHVPGPGASASEATVFVQKSQRGAETFQVACIMAGLRTALYPPNRGSGCFRVGILHNQGFRPRRSPIEEVEYEGHVWCVRTPTQTWLARRNGAVYFTGNCSGAVRWQDDEFTRHAESLGLTKVDRFDMLGTARPQPARRRQDGKPSLQQHAHGRPSCLLVFQAPRASHPTLL